MFCPYARDECKRSLCRMWGKEESGCLVALELEDQVAFRQEATEAEKLGLVKTTKDLSRVLNRVFLSNLLRSSSVSDEDRTLIVKLNRDFEVKSEAFLLEKLMRKGS